MANSIDDEYEVQQVVGKRFRQGNVSHMQCRNIVIYLFSEISFPC